eukprot:TRINITY_DN31212_c0_g1_i1.p1 TRINITY_DN31212_c0_g1~~TRINITY_DN31212_c0_g1_i1.p1  ORF type:complete len:102 (+),score=15.34 TRINITY_DN31212_c0_g1_i1:189-494(+)
MAALHTGWMEQRGDQRKFYRLREGPCLEYADDEAADEFAPVDFHGCDDPVLIPVVESRATMQPVPNVFHFRAGSYYVLFTCESAESYHGWVQALSSQFSVS